MVFRYKPGVFWAFLALTLLVISASPVSALGVPPYPGSAVINSASPAGLEVTILNVASGQPYEVVKDGLTSGAPVYLDRRYTFTTIPADLSNSTYIKTANKDKKQAQVDFLTFSVNQAVTVYVAYDERAKSLPDWLSDWDHIGARIDTTDVGHNLFSKDFAAGSITLGGNRAAGAAGARSNYSVIVAGQGPFIPPVDNAAPSVDAGQDQVVTLASPATAVLDGQVSDDGLPSGQLSFQWRQQSGPGVVSFGDVGAMDTTATFLEAGVYVLSLTADDGDLTTSDDVAVTVNQAAQTNQTPVVDAGPNMTIDLSTAAILDGAVSDDGLPSGQLSVHWSKSSGPGSVSFANAGAVDTTATFSVAGSYVLRLTADDGDLAASHDVTITVVAPSPGSTIQLNPNTQYQTIVGWEATAEIGSSTYPNEFRRWQDTVIDRAVNELGLNRLRLSTHQKKDAVEKTNDNGDPLVINWQGFDFTTFDEKIDNIVLPVKQRVEANGEKLYVNLNTVSVADRSVNPVHIDPDQFAELILAHFLHMQTKYGFVPDAVEVSLEPNVFNTFDENPSKFGAALVATGDRLKANGFTPDFIGPSNSNMANATQWFDKMIQVPGVLNYLTEFSYHRFGNQDVSRVQQIAKRAQQHGLGAAMLERIGADYNKLHEDLKIGNNVAWQQFTLAFPGTGDRGGAYYMIDRSDPNNPRVNIGSRTKLLRQYFKFVRRGAVRIEATSSNGNFDPLGFINANGKYVVVVKASKGGSFSIGALPADTYEIKYTTPSQYDVDLPDAVIGGGQSLTASIPDGGVITIYGK